MRRCRRNNAPSGAGATSVGILCNGGDPPALRTAAVTVRAYNLAHGTPASLPVSVNYIAYFSRRAIRVPEIIARARDAVPFLESRLQRGGGGKGCDLARDFVLLKAVRKSCGARAL